MCIRPLFKVVFLLAKKNIAGENMQKSYRIKKSQEIEQVMKRGRSKANPYFIVYKYANKETDNFRIAISVGKKIGKAFERNKIKRYIRNVTTEHKHEMNPDYDYFVKA